MLYNQYSAKPTPRSKSGLLAMTYNFDPDRWYENERDLLMARFKSGEIDAQALEDAISDLDRRYDEMVERLDGTYQLPQNDQDR